MTESPRVGLKRMIKRGILPVVKEENAYDQRNLFRGTVLRPAAAGAAAQAAHANLNDIANMGHFTHPADRAAVPVFLRAP